MLPRARHQNVRGNFHLFKYNSFTVAICYLVYLTGLFYFISVPPSIIDRETSSDMVVLESTNVSLTCKATGYPEPYVMWRREDGEDIRYNGEHGNNVI